MLRLNALMVTFAGLTVLSAAETKPLGEVGKERFKETFAKPELSSSWKKGPGDYSVADGVLTVREKKADMHVAALRAMVPVQDAVVQLEFKLDGARVFHVGFDPSPGELPGRTGHLVNVVISNKSIVIQKPGDKVNTQIKAKQLAKVDTAIEPGKWHTLRLAMLGTKMQAIIDDRHVVEAEDSEFKVKKPAVIFRVGGESVSIRSVQIAEAK